MARSSYERLIQSYDADDSSLNTTNNDLPSVKFENYLTQSISKKVPSKCFTVGYSEENQNGG